MDKFAGLANNQGMFYPAGFVVALIPNRADADATADDLRDKAFSDVREFSPQEIIDHLAEIKSNQSFFDRLSNALSEAEVPAAIALDYVKQGCYVVMTQAPDDATAARARDLISQHNARLTAHWSKWRVAMFEKPV
jgi:hypothetical protein